MCGDYLPSSCCRPDCSWRRACLDSGRAGLSGSGTAVGSGSSTWPPHQPATREELLDVPGIGEKKADAYGAAFLTAIADYEASVR